MTLQDLKDKLNTLDPYDVVRCGLDGLNAYAYVSLPPDMYGDHLNDTDYAEWEEYQEEWLRAVQQR